MNRALLVGIFWVVSGLAMLLLAFSREPRSNSLLVLGVVFVALGAALVRRSRRGGSPR